jgi:multidrug efflux pump subunit AcrA (membrane-fusion protein)
MEFVIYQTVRSLLLLLIFGTCSGLAAQEPKSPPAPVTQEAQAAEAPTETQAEKADDSTEETPADADKEADAESADEDSKSDESSADDEDEQDEEEKKEDKITLSGHFAAEKYKVVAVRPKKWTTFKVVEHVAHGTEVKKGDTLVQFDAISIDESLADAETEIKLSELALMESEHKLNLLKKTVPMRLEAAERAERIATENLKRFLTIKRNSRKRSAERSVTSAERWLAYQQEELNQLEKMYKADDLTEETEEIILLRTRHDVESAEYSLQRSREYSEEALAVDIPRLEESMEEAVRKAALALEESRLTLPADLEEAEHKHHNKQVQHERLVDRYERLQADRELMTLTAPISGTVYHGKPNHGKWSDPSSLASVLRPGGIVKPNQSILTVVKLTPIQITSWVKEEDLPTLMEGTSGTVKPTAYPESEFPATIKSLATVPAGTKFQAVLELGDIPDELSIVPGMTCKVEFAKETDEEESE